MQTLYCGNMVGDLLVQVTAAGVHLLSAPTGTLQDQWLPPQGLQINVACASPSQVQPCPVMPCPLTPFTLLLILTLPCIIPPPSSHPYFAPASPRTPPSTHPYPVVYYLCKALISLWHDRLTLHPFTPHPEGGWYPGPTWLSLQPAAPSSKHAVLPHQ